MFQSFDVTSDPSQGAARVARLREWLAGKKLDGFIVPRADEHQGEYVPARAERLSWLTGFTGSAGAAIILADSAQIFVDGRYTLQVRGQVDPSIFSVQNLVETPPAKWLGENAPKGARIGFDPWLHTIAEAKALKTALEKRGAELVAVAKNAVDAIWDDQPAAPLESVDIQPLDYAGELAKDKLARIAESLKAEGATHTILTDPSSLAWTFNIRGRDVPHTPLALGFAVISADGQHLLFMDKRKLPRTTEAYLTQLSDIRPPSTLESEIAALAKAGAKVGLDQSLVAEKLRLIVEENGGTVVSFADPARLPRATKNDAELAGTRNAHRRDGAAVSRFVRWIETRPPGSVDEIAAVTALENCRTETGKELQMPLRDISFDTISGAGPNGAVIHYRVTTATNRTLGPGELYLVDSGAQHQDGTTDITRTLPIGEPTKEMRERYTLVLKGMIQISMLRFPPGTRGADIDAFARAALWKAGLDYAHGTGHGVGSFLSVHEGPQRIAKSGTEKLLPGMILSNEPGYYKEGAYGIRLENLIVVTEAMPVEGGDLPMHGFETLTLVPFDKRMIATELLTREEFEWLNAYHARVREEVGPLLAGDERAWLEAATSPFADHHHPSR
ncbi:aminopeptidase P family protein [Mesorhizobium sp. J428]|uniref:aminopeptidase P family protein n=1 Tax=Mesorhizobium sp. J428 TaxID=2898440 RepID=UPI0021515257|nr:aminopeptidase P family protein [Mesorhizobium sp. J428]MCR5855326.1 aminopeptidase P family protein [Mesorhizobium sp. J428]